MPDINRNMQGYSIIMDPQMILVLNKASSLKRVCVFFKPSPSLTLHFSFPNVFYI